MPLYATKGYEENLFKISNRKEREVNISRKAIGCIKKESNMKATYSGRGYFCKIFIPSSEKREATIVKRT